MLLTCALGGCDRGGQAKLEQTAKSIESWSATLHETAQQWGRGSVPRIYVRQIAKAAEEELATESKDLEKAPAGAERDQLNQKLSDLRGRVNDLSAAAEKNNPQRIGDGGNG